MSRLILGDLGGFRHDPLAMLTRWAKTDRSVVPLRMAHLRLFLLLNPGDIERILVTDQENFIKPPWLRTAAVRRLLGDGLVTSEGAAWRAQRHACQPTFQPKCVDAFGDAMSEIINETIRGWEPGEALDLQAELTQITLRIVGQTLFGVEDDGWAQQAGAAMDAMMEAFTRGRSLFGFLPTPPDRIERDAARKLDRAADRIIALHACKPATPSSGNGADLLTQLNSVDWKGSTEAREKGAREQVKTFLTAGHESSALTLTWAFVLLAQNLAAGQRLRRELDDVLAGRRPTVEDLESLPYTSAVISETLRLYPPLWMTGRQSLQRTVIDGVLIPAGATLLTSQWAIHRSHRFFPDPEEFRPERWLGSETANLPRFAYFPFGGGPRTCIGKRFATLETMLILASIAQQYEVTLETSSAVEPVATMTLRPNRRVMARLISRRAAQLTR